MYFRIGQPYVDNWYWKQYAESGLFPLDKKWKDFNEQERNRLLYCADTPDGERLSKLVRYMGSALMGMTYIFDEPSTGMHPRDVYRMTRLLQNLRDRGNTVIVIEHNLDVMKRADWIIIIHLLISYCNRDEIRITEQVNNILFYKERGMR